MNNKQNFALGVAVGAGLMYLLDPERGNRRRALVRDQVVHAGHELEEMGDAARGRAQDLRNRARGAVTETRARMREERVDDRILEERVRAGIGRSVSNPGAIEIHARDGHVTLSGPVLAGEADDLRSAAGSVRGVRGVEDRLDVRDRPRDEPGLQGTMR